MSTVMRFALPQREALWVLLLAELPGLPPKPAGVLLVDLAGDSLHIALKEEVSPDEEISEVWNSMRQELEDQAYARGGARLLDTLRNQLSWFVQINGEPQRIVINDPEETLALLFQKYVG